MSAPVRHVHSFVDGIVVERGGGWIVVGHRSEVMFCGPLRHRGVVHV